MPRSVFFVFRKASQICQACVVSRHEYTQGGGAVSTHKRKRKRKRKGKRKRKRKRDRNRKQDQEQEQDQEEEVSEFTGRGSVQT